jgi:hypothetical protein
MTFLRHSGDKIIGSDFFPEAVYSGNRVVGNDWQAGGVLADVFEATLSSGKVVRLERLHSSLPEWDWKAITWQGNRIAKVQEGLRGRKAHRQITYDRDGEELEDLDLSTLPNASRCPKASQCNRLQSRYASGWQGRS